MSNADWTARRVNGRVFTAYGAAGCPRGDAMRSKIIEAWNEATDALVRRYVQIRTDWLCAPLESKQAKPDTSGAETGECPTYRYK